MFITAYALFLENENVDREREAELRTD